MNSREEVYAKVAQLSVDSRTEAEYKARNRIAGQPPQYTLKVHGKYPRKVVDAINRFSEILLLAAFTPSALRIFMASGTTFFMGVQSGFFGGLVGFTSIFLAEIGQVVCMLGFTTATTRFQRFSLVLGAFICTLYALAGNAFIAPPWEHGSSLFVYLETFAPPVLVLIAAHVRKSQIMYQVELLQEAQTRYQEEQIAWQSRYNEADKHPTWMRYFSNSLRDALVQENKRSKRIIRELTLQEWAFLIDRELKAEYWYDQVQVPTPTQSPPAQNPQRVTNGKDHDFKAFVSSNPDGTFTAMSPVTGHALRTNYKSSSDALKALSVHMKRYPSGLQ